MTRSYKDYCHIKLHRDYKFLVLIDTFVPLSAKQGYGDL